jgi:hypothetical protein
MAIRGLTDYRHYRQESEWQKQAQTIFYKKMQKHPELTPEKFQAVATLEGLYGVLQKITNDMKMIQDVQIAVPHSCDAKDIDKTFDMAIDAIEEVMQEIINYHEENQRLNRSVI